MGFMLNQSFIQLFLWGQVESEICRLVEHTKEMLDEAVAIYQKIGKENGNYLTNSIFSHI